MIFVTVGMHTQSFHRLIKAMDEIAADTDEKVIMQIGHSSYTPLHADWFHFLPYAEIQRLSCEARVVVCHGATSILTALQQGTPVVAVPREERYGEHIDDHQIEFVQALAKDNRIIAVRDVASLKSVLWASLPAPLRLGEPSLRASMRDVVTALSKGR